MSMLEQRKGCSRTFKKFQQHPFQHNKKVWLFLFFLACRLRSCFSCCSAYYKLFFLSCCSHYKKKEMRNIFVEYICKFLAEKNNKKLFFLPVNVLTSNQICEFLKTAKGKFTFAKNIKKNYFPELLFVASVTDVCFKFFWHFCSFFVKVILKVCEVYCV